MSTDTTVARDLFIRTTHPNGKFTVSHHRVWDAEKFIRARQHEATERARKDGVAQDVISMATADDYRAAR